MEYDRRRGAGEADRGLAAIETHLVSTRPQTVRIPGAGEVELREGETIRTEISCKCDRRSVVEMFTAAELEGVGWWEAPDRLFAPSLAAPAGEIG